MEFRNLTPLDALCFKTLDVEDNEFHVIAMKIAYTLRDGECIVDETNFPSLIVQDEFKGEINQSSVRFESDLAPAKTKCDVIVNGNAYAPKISPDAELEAGVVLNENGEVTEFVTSVLIKDGLDQVLLDKSLTVRGAQQFYFPEKYAINRKQKSKDQIQASEIVPVTMLPLDYEYAFGGENKLYADNPYAENLSDKAKLTAAQLAGHPEENPPLAHTIYEANLLGQGFLESWYLTATQNRESLLAPQIYDPGTAFTVESIERQLQGDRSTSEFKPAGFGAVSRTAPHRRKLAGTYDDEWIEKRHPYLPSDFDFSYWNCAPEDQQIEFPENHMQIHLKNMTKEGSWQIALPAHRAFVLLRMKEGAMFPIMLDIDTIVIEPELDQVLLTYKGIIPTNLEIRVIEARFEVNPEKPLVRIQKGDQ